MIDWLTNNLDAAQTWLFLQFVEPVLYKLGLIGYDEPAFDATAFFLYGCIQITLLYVIMRPLETFFPVEVWRNRKDMRADVIYTLITRLGLLPILFFVLLDPFMRRFDGWLRMQNLLPYNLEHLSSRLAASPILGVCLYVVVLDFADYWRHRFQHRFDRWWALHSLHHSQRTMSVWTDDRNHLLDEAIGWFWFSVVALMIGVQSAQFVAIVIAGRMVESLSHANVRFGFGRLGDRLLVSPPFHRRHHAMGVGHAGRAHGCNFAVLFPLWDILLGTADFSREKVQTGILDQLEGRDYGDGFWRQQYLGLRRLFEKNPCSNNTSGQSTSL